MATRRLQVKKLKFREHPSQYFLSILWTDGQLSYPVEIAFLPCTTSMCTSDGHKTSSSKEVEVPRTSFSILLSILWTDGQLSYPVEIAFLPCITSMCTSDGHKTSSSKELKFREHPSQYFLSILWTDGQLSYPVEIAFLPCTTSMCTSDGHKTSSSKEVESSGNFFLNTSIYILEIWQLPYPVETEGKCNCYIRQLQDSGFGSCRIYSFAQRKLCTSTP
ncbi:hypothetical protein CEXT_538341 [Caerostris extrusa]|uniref:Uncharacterized protein n=1 Tax=Caerostris extrusa TaxID=172846 RepID=A0AAV4SK53_CAEEX|nr:hypothetical protein CEXT_538341 [Caerostris extrusa]